MATRVSGEIHVTAPGADIGGTFTVAINTTTAAVDRSFALGGSAVALELPAGPYVRVEGIGATITIGGQTLTADIAIERSTDAAGSPITVIGANNVAFAVNAGSTPVLRLAGGSGAFVITSAGLAGRLGGQVALNVPAAVSFTGTLTVAVNTTFTAVTQDVEVGGATVSLSLPAGPYLRFEGTGLAVDVLGQRLTGDFAFEQATDLGADKVPGGGNDTATVKVAAANVSLTIGGSTPIVSVTQGTATFLLTTGGLAGRVQGNLAVALPQVSLSGNLAVEVNTTGAAVDTTLQVGSAPLALKLEQGPFVRVAGTGVQLSVLGQTLSGDFSIARSTDASGSPVTKLHAENVKIVLGGTPSAPLLTVTQKSAADFTITAAGIVGSLAVGITLATPGVTFTGQNIAIDINTTGAAAAGLPAGPFIRVAGTGIALNVFGQSLSADVTFEQATDAQGGKVVRVGVAKGSLSLAGGLVSATGGTGLFVVTPTGVAGSIAVSLAVDVTDLTIAGSFSVALNTTSAAVSEQLTVGGAAVALDLPAGPYLRVDATGVVLKIAGQVLTGSFSFEQSAGTVRISASDVGLALGDGTQNVLTLSDGSGLFIIDAAGKIAGRVHATAALNGIPGATLSATLDLELNQTGGAVDPELNLDAGTYVRVSGTAVTDLARRPDASPATSRSPRTRARSPCPSTTWSSASATGRPTSSPSASTTARPARSR